MENPTPASLNYLSGFVNEAHRRIGYTTDLVGSSRLRKARLTDPAPCRMVPIRN